MAASSAVVSAAASASASAAASASRSNVGSFDLYSETIGAGEPVVLLHGGFCSLEHLRPLAEQLAREFEVFAFERPGHGRSPDRAGAFSYDDGVAQTVAFLDAAGLGSAHVVGFSDGAVIALMLATEHPELVRSLVAISGNLSPEGYTGTADDVSAGDISASEMADGLDSALRAYGELSPDGADHAPVILEKLAELWMSGPNIQTADLARVDVPTLIVSGEFDTIDPQHSRLIADSIPGARLCIVAGATHDLIDERPAAVFGAVARHLRTARRPNG
ncbi:alpha/beta fold hydrolase [Subtercola endophyticus]|uniref:alpha/beta fold hydrolase n=1 Tax=Subtercola endophyticus TaxID=2895559 RepID=UPI001E5E0138|nr:alpha/beta hydrolase [Subtercola endophyticus]UFS57504.1 alpha/beta hydrolase [Subtercola endophyticus]